MKKNLTLPGKLAIIGSVTLLLYTLTKEWFVQVVGHAPRIVDQETGIVWHLLENVPLALIGGGLFLWYRSQRSAIGRIDRYGALLTLLGTTSAFVSHFVEHVALILQSTPSVVVTASIWWYYGSWVLIALGLTTISLSRTESHLLKATQRSVVAWIVPISIAVALLLDATVFVSISDGFKIPLVIVIIVIGINLRDVIGSDDETVEYDDVGLEVGDPDG